MEKCLRLCDKCKTEIAEGFGYKEYRIELLNLGSPAGHYDMRRYELCRDCYIEIFSLIDPETAKVKYGGE